MKTKTLFLVCAVFAYGCNDAPPRNTTQVPALPEYMYINPDSIAKVKAKTDSIAKENALRTEQAESIGKTFVLPDSTLQNIAISGKILSYKDNAAVGELVLKDKKAKKVIQKLPFMLNNKFSNAENCIEAGDFDFDGNMDIVVPNGVDPEAVSPNIYVVYLYNNEKQQFEKNEDLGNTISSGDEYEILSDKKTLLVYRKGGSIENYYDIYKIENKTACPTQWIMESYKDDGKVEVVVSKTECDGKEIAGSEKTYKHKPYPDNYKGRGYYRKYIE
jgi:hypothetical protein